MKKISLGQKDIVHFVGIGGIGMSGLAQIMKNMGFKVQGSDQTKNKNTKSLHKVLCYVNPIRVQNPIQTRLFVIPKSKMLLLRILLVQSR